MMYSLMHFIKDYIKLALFAGGLLVGVQIPAFVNQYEQRVQAHLVEARQNLSGFEFTAQRYFDGSLEKLILHYQNSQDRVFQQDAISIRNIYERVQLLTREALVFEQSPLNQTWHVIFDPQPELFEETKKAYSYQIQLSPGALIWGISMAILLALVLDTLFGGCVYCARKVFGKRNHAAYHHST